MKYVPIGSVASVRSGFAFKSKDWTETGIPVIKIANVKDGFVSLDGCSFVNEYIALAASEFELKSGDILISMTGYIGEVARVRNEGRMLLNQRVGKFRINEPELLDADFLFYCLRDSDIKAQFAAHAYGAAQPNISPSLIEQQQIPLPPLPIQRRIAGILSAYDDLIENSQRRIKILEEMTRRLYREWFVHFRFPGHEGCRFMDSPLGEIPEGWEARRLNDVTNDIVDYRGKTPTKLGGEWSDKGIIALSALNVKNGHLVNLEKSKRVSEELYARWMKNPLRQGDILMTSEAPLGELFFLCRHERYCLSQRLFCIRANPDIISPVILYFNLGSEKTQCELNSRASGSTVLGIRQSELRNIPVLVPSMDIQKRAEQILNQLAENIYTLDAQTKNLRHTRDLLLPRLLSGQIDVEALPEPSLSEP